MAGDILSEPEKGALVAAVKDVEQRSSAEVVIAFRGCSGRYLDADLIAGSLLSFLTLRRSRRVEDAPHVGGATD